MSEVTHAQVDKVLRSLGFSCRRTTLRTEALVYEHPQTGALVILPASTDRHKVLPHDLAAVQATLKAYGIVDPLDFAVELQNAS
jgi:hypothetical protein